MVAVAFFPSPDWHYERAYKIISRCGERRGSERRGLIGAYLDPVWRIWGGWFVCEAIGWHSNRGTICSPLWTLLTSEIFNVSISFCHVKKWLHTFRSQASENVSLHWTNQVPLFSASEFSESDCNYRQSSFLYRRYLEVRTLANQLVSRTHSKTQQEFKRPKIHLSFRSASTQSLGARRNWKNKSDTP